MTNDNVVNAYFEWLCELVCDETYTKKLSYRKLLMYLHSTEFRYSISYDGNRAEDGVDLRTRFADDYGIADMDLYLKGSCSVLEMMIALAVRCEVHIMDDPDIGDRTGQWFWGMVVNLGLGSMDDRRFNKDYVSGCITRFLDRRYEIDGKGGLFRLKHCKTDLRTVEIWYQMCWYLDEIL